MLKVKTAAVVCGRNGSWFEEAPPVRVHVGKECGWKEIVEATNEVNGKGGAKEQRQFSTNLYCAAQDVADLKVRGCG
jgi:hypothetical protein